MIFPLKLNLTKSSALLLAVILSIFTLLVCMVNFIHVGYYTDLDLFGVFTDNAVFFCIAVLLIVLLMFLFFKEPNSGKMNSRVEVLFAIMPFLVLFVLKFVLPDMLETYYVTNFSDAPVHLIKGLFVANTGHTNVLIEGYFDQQPGFFWLTGMILTVIRDCSFSIINPISLFILKWFHVLIYLAYVPILFIFYKKLLGHSSLVGAALLLQLGLDFCHYHYAAQSYGNLLYWMCLLLMLCYSTNKDRRVMVLLPLVGLTIAFEHQGLIIFTLVSMAAMVAYPYVFRIIERKRSSKVPEFSKKLLFPLLIVFLGWFIFLIFGTIYTFGSFIDTLKDVAMSLFSENVSLVSSGVQRANPLWQQIVTWKTVYLGALIIAGLVLSFINARRTKSDVDKGIFVIQLFTVIIVGSIAIGVGGSGYVERLQIMLPLIVYAMIKFVLNIKKSPVKKNLPKLPISILAVFLITVVIISGLSMYFSGRNFQSVTRSELATNSFIIIHDPQTIAGLYSKTPVQSASNLFSYEQMPAGIIYEISHNVVIQSGIYITGDYQSASSFYSNLAEKNNQIYDDNTVQLIMSPG